MNKLAYRINEAATVTGLGRTTLYALIKAGKLLTFKVGGCTLISAQELDRFLVDSARLNDN